MNRNFPGIPDKPSFKRDEVIKLTRLDGRVLDFWQKEFGGFVPLVDRGGEIVYTPDDIRLILRIKQLLLIDRVEKSKVKEMVRTGGDAEKKVPAAPPAIKKENNDHKKVLTTKAQAIPGEKLRFIRQSLQEILTILDKHDKK